MHDIYTNVHKCTRLTTEQLQTQVPCLLSVCADVDMIQLLCVLNHRQDNI